MSLIAQQELYILYLYEKLRYKEDIEDLTKENQSSGLILKIPNPQDPASYLTVIIQTSKLVTQFDRIMFPNYGEVVVTDVWKQPNEDLARLQVRWKDEIHQCWTPKTLFIPLSKIDPLFRTWW
jgi:hypothetical protein